MIVDSPLLVEGLAPLLILVVIAFAISGNIPTVEKALALRLEA